MSLPTRSKYNWSASYGPFRSGRSPNIALLNYPLKRASITLSADPEIAPPAAK